MMALFDDDVIQEMYIESKKEEARAEGQAEGLLEGKISMLWEMVKDKVLTKEAAAKKVNMTVDAFDEKVKLVLSESEL